MDNLREFSPQTVTDFTTDFAKDFAKDFSAGAEAPARLGHYLLERELGRGFSSIVYGATDLQRHRTVALKVLTFLQSLSEDRRADLSQRFQREAKAVSALSHPNIVAIFEVGHTEDGLQFIAMEYLAGETLRRRLHQSTPLAVPQAVEIAIRVADALHYAHGRGIIHRDVKPDNIFLAQDGDEAPILPKLMDFGIAHVLSDQGQTQDGTIVGSPAYMSPEQINGEPLDARTDVFSLAVTLAEMVGGTKPFEGSTIPAVMQQILHHAPDLRRIGDRGLQRVLTKALSKNPNGRYPDAAAFAQALRQAVPLAGLAPSETTHIIEVMPARFARPRRLPPPAALVLGVMSLVTLALLPLFTPHPKLSAPPASARLVPSLGAHRHQIDTAWRPAAAAPDSSFRIAETTLRSSLPVSAVKSPSPITRLRPTPPVPPAAPTLPTAPAMPATPAAADLPLMATATHSATLRPAPRLPLKFPVRPIVRVAGMQQEMRTTRPAPAKMAPTAPPATGTVEGSDTLPPAREAGLPDAAPQALHRTMPALPDDAPEGLDNTTVRLRVSVNEDGSVDEATVLTSSGSPALDHAALEAVRQWEYNPAIRDGQSVPGVVNEQVTFAAR